MGKGSKNEQEWRVFKKQIMEEAKARLLEEKHGLTRQVQKLRSIRVSQFKGDTRASYRASSASTSTSRPTHYESRPSSPMSNLQPRSTPYESRSASPMSNLPPRSTPYESRPASPMSKFPLAMNNQQEQGQHSLPKSPAGASSKQSPSCPLTPRTPPDNSQAKAPRIDGKEFFRLVRSRYTYEQFDEFFNKIKQLIAWDRQKELKAAEASKFHFHPKIYISNTQRPPEYGDWVITSSKVVAPP